MPTCILTPQMDRIGASRDQGRVVGFTRRACGQSLVEVLVAVLVMGVLGFSLYDAMFATVRGVQVDRVNELRRQLTLDLLERFGQPYSDIEWLFSKGTPSPATKQLDLDTAMKMVAIPETERPVIKSILASASVLGFTIVWHRGLTVGSGEKNRLRKDRIWVHTVYGTAQPAARIDSFRVFCVRES